MSVFENMGPATVEQGLRDSLSAALRELGAVRAELAALRNHELAVAEVSGIVYEADGHNSEPGPRGQVIEALREHKRAWFDEQELRWRVETLQEELAAIKARRCGTCKWWRHCEPDGHGKCRRPYPQECSGWVGGSAWEGEP